MISRTLLKNLGLGSNLKFRVISVQISNLRSFEVKFEIWSHRRSKFKFGIIWGQSSNFESFEVKLQILAHLRSKFKFEVISGQIKKILVSRSPELTIEILNIFFRAKFYFFRPSKLNFETRKTWTRWKNKSQFSREITLTTYLMHLKNR